MYICIISYYITSCYHILLYDAARYRSVQPATAEGSAGEGARALRPAMQLLAAVLAATALAESVTKRSMLKCVTVYIHLSLSLSIYIYIYIYICVCIRYI